MFAWIIRLRPALKVLLVLCQELNRLHRKLVRILARGAENQTAAGALQLASHDLRDRGCGARRNPEFYLCATSVFVFGTSVTKLSVDQETAAQVIGVGNFVG